MEDIADYLIENYFPRYTGHPLLAQMNRDVLINFLEIVKDNVVIVKDDNIKGCAVFLTLTDDTYRALGCLDMYNVLAMQQLFYEQGDNIHFILLCADSYKTIMRGINKTKQRKPKSISWWNPEMSRLHKYNLGG